MHVPWRHCWFLQIAIQHKYRVFANRMWCKRQQQRKKRATTLLQSLQRGRLQRRKYRRLRFTKQRAARVIQQAWHDDEPRRRARDAWLAELAARAAYRERVRHAIVVSQRFCRMAPKAHYYRRLLKATLAVQVRVLQSLKFSEPPVVVCWVVAYHGRGHLVMSLSGADWIGFRACG